MNALDVLKAQASASGLTVGQQSLLDKLSRLIGDYQDCPNVIDSTNISSLDGATLKLAPGQNITLSASAWAGMSDGISFLTDKNNTNTIALSDGAVKENSSGVSGSPVVLAKSCIYTVSRAQSGAPNYHFVGAPFM